MHHRIEVATDVARIGAWDASGDAEPFYVEIGADWGGPVDVYVDETAPEHVTARVRKPANECVVCVPSGRLVIAGAEDYRSANPRTIGPDSEIVVPAGEYRVRAYVVELDEADEAAAPSVRDAEEMLDPDDRTYYRAVNRSEMRTALIGYSLFLLFPIFVFPFGWKIALAVTVGVVLAYFGFFGSREERRRKADARWQRINKQVGDRFLHGQRAALIIELSVVAPDHTTTPLRSEASR
jgi:hypothetical protein